MSADTKYIVTADGEDKKGLAGQRPAFELFGQDYFHGDEFVPPVGFVEQSDVPEGMAGQGVRFVYRFQVYGADGAPAQTADGHPVYKEGTTILPVRRVQGDGQADAAPVTGQLIDAVPAKPKKRTKKPDATGG